ncbi:hypothetical protein H8959_016124 [Pygathrix nigripes]
MGLRSVRERGALETRLLEGIKDQLPLRTNGPVIPDVTRGTGFTFPELKSRLPATRTVYCMNEAEIVDVALGILIESHKQEKACEQPALAGADNPELSPPCSLSPHTSSGSSSEEEDSGKEALAAGLSPSQRPGDSNSACSRSPKEEEEEEEEDVLKYVREIFFS